jgi:hypothetical protein
MEKLRFTDDWPPLQLWERYPNWEFAFDEEGVEGQDETTLKPSERQDCIHELVAWTLADVKLASGEHKPAFLCFFNFGERGPNEVQVLVRDGLTWGMWYDERQRKWLLYDQAWMREEVRQKTPLTGDPTVFPMRVSSRLPFAPTGLPYRFLIDKDGSESEVE